MNKVLKSIYYRIPFKYYMFELIKKLYKPDYKTSGYLKFKRSFKLKIDSDDLLLFNNNSTLASLLYWNGIEGYESKSIATWIKLSKEAQIVLDVGANFGLFGLLTKAVNKNSEVHFFEPIKRNCKLIERNVSINNFNNLVINEKAASNFNGKATFYDMAKEENTIASFKAEFVKSHKHHKELIPIQVDVISLDTYISQRNIERIDLVKIDVEGVDVEVIEGFKCSIEKFHPNILIEITDKESGQRINEIFKTLNVKYIFYEINENNGLVLKDKIDRANGRNYLFRPIKD